MLKSEIEYYQNYLKKFKFGNNIKSKFFLNNEYIYINNASRGVTPIEILDDSKQIYSKIESLPYSSEDAFNEYQNVSNYLAKFINASMNSVVLTRNITYGINSVVNSFNFNENDAILITNLIYPASKNIINNINKKYNTKIIEQKINFPIIDYNSIINDYKKIIKNNKNIKFVLIEHITSPTALTLPIKELIDIAHKNNIKILIDGAHAVGTLDVNITKLDPDWYIGSLHKWCFTNKGVGFLYTSSINQSFTKNIIVSHNHKKDYMRNFFMSGTEDQSIYLSIIKSFNFINKLGGVKNIINYDNNLVLFGAKICCAKWKTDTLIPFNLCGPTMVPIILPFDYKTLLNRLGNHKKIPIILKEIILKNYKIDSILFLAVYNNEIKICVRLSAQIYNTMNDYIKYADIILEIKKCINP